MDIRQLRTFVQVAEMRSITRAAAALHTAQPALSRQLRLLEEGIGWRGAGYFSSSLSGPIPRFSERWWCSGCLLP